MHLSVLKRASYWLYVCMYSSFKCLGEAMGEMFISALILFLVLSVGCASRGTLEGNRDTASDLECPANVIPFPCETNSNNFHSNCSCNCSSIPGSIIKCGSVNNSYSIQLLQSYCMTLFNGSVIVGGCFYGSRNWTVKDPLYYEFRYNDLLINKSMCDALNRTGPLCAHCKEGHGMALYSNSWSCKKCTLNSGVSWALYVALETVPVIIFFLVVVFFNVRVTSPPMTGFVFFSQVLISVGYSKSFQDSLFEVHPKTEPFAKIALTLYGVWNLDFFRELIPEFCVSPHLSNTGAVALDYIGTLCPLLLVLISVVCVKLHDYNFRPIVCIWRPVHRCLARRRRSWNPNASIVDALATFLLLSYSLTAVVTFKLLYMIKVYTVCGNAYPHYTMYIDGSKGISAQSFIPAILVSLVVILFPPLLLIVYQTKLFRKFLMIVRLDSWPPLHMFVDQFQGNYKDGTEGTYDYRFLSGVYLVFRIVFVVPFDLSFLHSGYYRLMCIVLFFSATLFQALVQPYKKRYMNVLETLIFALCSLITVVYLCYLYLPPSRFVAVIAVVMLIMASIPMCVFLCYIGYKFIHCIYISKWFNKRVLNFLRKITGKRVPSAEDGPRDDEVLDDSFADRLQQPCRYYGSLTDSFDDSLNSDRNGLISAGLYTHSGHH